MLNLTSLIIARIDKAKNIHHQINQIFTKYKAIYSTEEQFKINRAVLNYLSQVKKQQKESSRREEEFLSDIKGLRFFSSKIVEQVYCATLEIFSYYDSQFEAYKQAHKITPDTLKSIYLTFFQKYRQKINAKYVLRLVSNHITESTPFILLGWICQWTRNSFFQEIQSAIGNQIKRHEQQMKKLSNFRLNNNSIVNNSPKSYSASVTRCQDQAIFTNKQSVFGLFLDQLNQYYKLLPLDLDYSFLKSMRKLHIKDRQFLSQQNLQKAAVVIIQAKNRIIRQQILKYEQEYKQYQQWIYEAKSGLKKQKRRNVSLLLNSQKQSNIIKIKKNQRMFFERVKSEGKEEATSNVNIQFQNRKSLFLQPKTNKISFQSSNQIMEKFKKQRSRKAFQFPLIAHPNRNLSENVRSSIKKKQIHSYFTPVNRSMFCNYEKIAIRNGIESTKNSQVNTLLVGKVEQRINYSEHGMPQILQVPIVKKREGGEKKRRKLMLQLLREKNRRDILDE